MNTNVLPKDRSSKHAGELRSPSGSRTRGFRLRQSHSESDPRYPCGTWSLHPAVGQGTMVSGRSLEELVEYLELLAGADSTSMAAKRRAVEVLGKRGG